MQKIGIRSPRKLPPQPTDYYYSESTGMEYEFWRSEGIVGAWHEDVGLVTYYYADHKDWDRICGCEDTDNDNDEENPDD